MNRTQGKTRTDVSIPRDDSDRAPVELLAEEYLEQLRQGRKPPISDYVRAHPELADEIRELFPTLGLLEHMAPRPDTAAPRDIPEEPALPLLRVAEYRVVREVGRGGMGIVYEAEHETMNRRVALKVLPPGLAARPANLHRFLREARSAGRLHHTNIVPVFEIGEDAGLHYYAMQFIQGQNLDVVIDEVKRLRFLTDNDPDGGASASIATVLTQSPEPGLTVAHGLVSGTFHVSRDCERDSDQWGSSSGTEQLRGISGSEGTTATSRTSHAQTSTALSHVGPQRESYYHRVARIGVQVAEALDYAHSQGVLHRDIKPSNLILDTAGVVWITDFGLAKSEGDDFTHTGDVVGTLRYMAPERFRGHADHRSDLYSLGLTLYELCTLQPAFRANDRAELINQLTGARPAPPRALDPHIPRDLETVILKATERDPAARYRSARTMVEDLRLFLSDCPVRSRRASASERLFRWCRRNPVPATLSLLIVVLLLALAAGSLWFGWSAGVQAARLHAEKLRAQEAEQAAELARHDATRRLYDSCVDRADARRMSGRPGQHFAALEAIAEANHVRASLTGSPAELAEQSRLLRSAAVAAMPLLDVQTVQSWTLRADETACVAFAPDFRSYAQSDSRGRIAVRDSANQQLLRILPSPGEKAWILQYSRDGQWLSAKYHRGDARPTSPTIRIWEVATGRLVLELTEQLAIAPVAFHGNGQTVAIGFHDGRVRLYSLPDATPVGDITVPHSVSFLAYSPDNSRLAIACDQQSQLHLVDVESGELQKVQLPSLVSSLAWRHGHDELATGMVDGSIYLLSLEPDYTARRRLIAHTKKVTRLQFLWQGRVLVSSAWDGTTRVWNVETGEVELRIDGADAVDHSPSHDRLLGFRRGEAEFGIWSVSGGMPLQFLCHSDDVHRRWSARFHPHLARLLAVGTSRGVELWDVQRQQLLRRLGTREVRTVAFRRQGEELVTSGAAGIEAWDLELGAEHAVTGTLVVEVAGPRTLCAGTFGDLDADAAGRFLLAIKPFQAATLLDLTSPTTTAHDMAGHLNVDRVTIDPAARWGVTTTWKGSGMWLWDLAARRPLLDLAPDVTSAMARFSSDGRWLAATTDQRIFVWECGQWLTPTVIPRSQPDDWPAVVAFSPDGQLLAAPHSRFVVQLLRPATGESLTLLTSPFSDETLDDYAFSHDGRFLAATDSRRVHVWDLNDLRERLQSLGLDWSDTDQAGILPVWRR